MQSKYLEIYAKNFFFLFLNIIWSGTYNVIPQVFFLKYYPNEKNLLLGAFLMLGSCASILGINFSRVIYHNKFITSHKKQLIKSVLIVIVGFLFIGILKTNNLFLYFSTFIFLKFISSFLYNLFDLYHVATTPSNLLKTYVQSNLIYLLAGIIFATFYFPLLIEDFRTNVVVFVLLIILSLAYRPEKEYEKITNLNNKLKINIYRKSLNINDILFLIYVFLVYIAIYLFTAIVIYLLQDYYGFNDFRTVGGALIGITCLISVFFVVFILYLVKKSKKVEARQIIFPKFHIILFSMFFAAVVLLYLKLWISYPYILAIACLTGGGYGILLGISRNYASAMASRQNKPEILSHYNNLQNYACVISFGSIIAVSYVCKMFTFDFNKIIILIIGFFYILSCGVYIRLTRKWQ